MPDLLYIIVILAFFAAGASLARGCDRLSRSEADD